MDAKEESPLRSPNDAAALVEQKATLFRSFASKSSCQRVGYHFWAWDGLGLRVQDEGVRV